MTVGIAGCGDGKPPAIPVGGVVTIDGKPAEGVSLVFYAEEPFPAELQVPTPRAFTDESGAFQASTYTGGDGLPAGKYTVAAVRRSEVPSNADPESVEAVDLLRGKYANPTTSGLSVEVPSGGIESLEFALTSDD
ncbi:MAG: hypothetical protein AAF266_13200 [Planctomycetota bacterium]